MTRRAPQATLSKDEILRYSRHLIMPEVGMEGQLKLKAAKVLLIGAGGLGAPLGLYLAAAGVGRIGLVDFDVVDFTNLQRQVIHGTKDVGRKKLDSAAENDARHQSRTSRSTSTKWRSPARTRSRSSRTTTSSSTAPTTSRRATWSTTPACCWASPTSTARSSASKARPRCSPIEGGPCYRCLYPEPPPPGLVPSCAEGGVLGILPGIIGLIQATEAVKLILGIGEPLVGRLLLYDALGMRFRELKLRKNPECPVCGDHPTITKLIDYQQFCGIPQQHEAPRRSQGDRRRNRSGRSEGEDRPRRQLRADRRARAARVPDLQHPRRQADPAGRLPKRVNELDPEAEIVVHCKSGMRSAKAFDILQAGRLQASAQHEGRHPGLERQGRSQRAEVLVLYSNRPRR